MGFKNLRITDTRKKMTYWKLSLASFLERNQDRLFLHLAGVLLFVKIFLKVLGAFPKVGWTSFLIPTLTSPLLIVFLLYIGMLVLACFWSRILKIPVSFIFLILPFFLYFILLVNNLSFHWADQAVLSGAMGLLISGAWFWRPKLTENISSESTTQQDGRLYLLIGIFVVHGILLFLGQNFKTSRVPFADENTFWFTAARKMLDKGFLAAHQAGYAGGGLHPLGVPFLNAFPGMLVHSDSYLLPFFMPVYIILGLTLVLLEIVDAQPSKSRWGFLFFLAAWMASFNNKTWAGSLFYSMVYGESVCMVLVLSLLSWFSIYKERAIGCSTAAAAFLLGLLALTKFPFILLSMAFFITFLWRFWDGTKGLKKSLLMIGIFFLPFVVLKLFQLKYGGTISSIGGVSFNRLLLPHMDMVWRVIDNITVDARNLWYYFFIAGAASCFCQRQWTYGWPVLLWVFFLFIYYAYIYAYGLAASGDAASGLRYFLPAASGFFFLGANGMSCLADIIQRQPHQLFRAGLYLVFIIMNLYKVF